LAVLAVLVMAGGACPLAPEEVLVSANVAEVGKGYRTSELRGRAVWNDRNERIGTIPEVVIGRDDVAFAILEVGGFLELLDVHMVAVPFKALKIDEASRKIMLPGGRVGHSRIFRSSDSAAEQRRSRSKIGSNRDRLDQWHRSRLIGALPSIDGGWTA
jgi:PRC-barrel domain